jgi:AraC-like DNA-binding protein
MDEQWTFAVMTECQRFACATSMEGTLEDGPRHAKALAVALPPPPDALSARFLRATLLELAVRWGAECHRRVMHQCRANPCALATLADASCFWPVQSPDGGPGKLFVAHVTAITNELTRTHGVSLSARAAALFWESGGSTSVESAARTLRTHPSTLRRAFQREMRTTARDYRTRVRLALAESLLADGTNEKVEPVAYASGWSSRSGLYRAFRRFRDETPGQARQVP